jgi:hypothetical protein
MAGDWIKMRTDLYRDPKVCVMADLLMNDDSDLARYINQHRQCDMVVTRNVMRNVTVGALVSVWGVLRHRGKRIDNNLFIRGCTINVIDDLADIPGFGEAMQFVGWVEECAGGVVFPNFFEEFNVDPAEELKAKNAERQRRFREKKKEENSVISNVTVTSQSNAREEKRREEKHKGGRLPSDWFLPEEWIQEAQSINPSFTVPEILFIADGFKDYWHGVAGAKGVKLDWLGTWRNWIRKQDKRPNLPQSKQPLRVAI